ncbi:MAG: HU family DNA-binding protein [Oscillospiraceae bacterium]
MKFTEVKTMTKAELINAVAEKGEFTKKDAEKAVKAFTEVVTEALQNGDKVQLVGFGTFEVRDRAAKETINPRTHEKQLQPAHKVPAFKAGKGLKDSVNNK